MEINKISTNTPDKYSVGEYLKYYRLTDEHILLMDNSFGNAFPINTDYEVINNYIAKHFEFACYNFEDRGDYWEFIEVDEENCKYDYEPDYEEEEEEDEIEKIDAENRERNRIYNLLIDLFNNQKTVNLSDEYTLDIEYYGENINNIFNAVVVLKHNGELEKNFPMVNHYTTISAVLSAEIDVLFMLTDNIYMHFYNKSY